MILKIASADGMKLLVSTYDPDLGTFTNREAEKQGEALSYALLEKLPALTWDSMIKAANKYTDIIDDQEARNDYLEYLKSIAEEYDIS